MRYRGPASEKLVRLIFMYDIRPRAIMSDNMFVCSCCANFSNLSCPAGYISFFCAREVSTIVRNVPLPFAPQIASNIPYTLFNFLIYSELCQIVNEAEIHASKTTRFHRRSNSNTTFGRQTRSNAIRTNAHEYLFMEIYDLFLDRILSNLQ